MRSVETASPVSRGSMNASASRTTCPAIAADAPDAARSIRPNCTAEIIRLAASGKWLSIQSATISSLGPFMSGQITSLPSK